MGDSNTDDLVLAFLKRSGVDAIDDEIASIGELGSEEVYAACGHCMNVIMEERGEAQRFSKKLAANPGVRFRACTALANAISALGFPGEIGFNHFLYPSEKETRQLLLFVVDQMPKGDADEGGGGALSGGTASFEEQVRTALVDALQVPWVPVAWQAAAKGRPLLPERALYLRRALRQAALGAARRAERQAAIEERLQSLGADKENDGSTLSGGFGDAPPGWDEKGKGGASAYGGGFGSSAGGLFAHSALFNHDESHLGDEGVSSSAASDKETPAQRAERLERERLQQVLGELDAVLAAIKEQKALAEAAAEAEASIAAAVKQLEGGVKEATGEQEKRDADHVTRKRALELATDPDGSRERLNKAIAKTGAALMELAEEWETVRAPMLDKIKAAQKSRDDRRDGAMKKMATVKQLRTDMRTMVRDLQERDETMVRLQAELGKSKGNPRASYTDRILDVVRNVRKQKAGIESILRDIRESQKEVNSLSETLQRSFAAADEVIFRDADRTKSAASKQCYKALARMHEAFGNLVEHVQSIANATSTTNELQAKYEELSAKKVPEAIERVSADLKLIKAENARLELEKAGAPPLS